MIFRNLYPDVMRLSALPLTDYVLRGAGTRAAKPAIVDGPGGRSHTYGRLARAIRRAAAGLAEPGLRQGEVMAIGMGCARARC